jgi:hypothetical protein
MSYSCIECEREDLHIEEVAYGHDCEPPKEYNGWKNRSTWNCALWLDNDEGIYKGAVDFMKDYKGKRPYIDFCRESGLDSQKTPDGIQWISQLLDYAALDRAMWENAPETAPCTRCEKKVDPDSLTPYGDWKLCEDCAGEM